MNGDCEPLVVFGNGKERLMVVGQFLRLEMVGGPGKLEGWEREGFAPNGSFLCCLALVSAFQIYREGLFFFVGPVRHATNMIPWYFHLWHFFIVFLQSIGGMFGSHK